MYLNEISFLVLLLQFSCLFLCFPHLRDRILLEMKVKINSLLQLHLLMIFFRSNRKETNIIDKHILTYSYCWKPCNQYNEEICLASIIWTKSYNVNDYLEGEKRTVHACFILTVILEVAKNKQTPLLLSGATVLSAKWVPPQKEISEWQVLHN